MSLAYSVPLEMAELKILGLVVTPTTPALPTLDGSECASWPEIFERERSSNQIDVPAEEISS